MTSTNRPIRKPIACAHTQHNEGNLQHQGCVVDKLAKHLILCTTKDQFCLYNIGFGQRRRKSLVPCKRISRVQLQSSFSPDRSTHKTCFGRLQMSTKAHSSHRATAVHPRSAHVPAWLSPNLDAAHGVSTSSVWILIDIAQRLAEQCSGMVVRQ